MQQFGSVVDHKDVETGATVTWIDGKAFRCFGFTISVEQGNTDVTVKNTLDEVMFQFTVSGRSALIMNIPFYADHGIKVLAVGSTAHVTIIRSNPIGEDDESGTRP
jgi:hypothetical protein